MSPRYWFGVAAASLVASASASHAGVIWNETVDGDLSGDRLNPTNLALVFGANSVIATSVAGDREYVHLQLNPGDVISQILHVSWLSFDNVGFIGVQAGTTFTEPPTGVVVGNLLGYFHFGAGSVGLDILPLIGAGPGSMGFTPPLTGSDYTFWIQQTGANASTYRLDFVVVPGPAAAVVLGVAGLAGAARRRRA